MTASLVIWRTSDTACLMNPRLLPSKRTISHPRTLNWKCVVNKPEDRIEMCKTQLIKESRQRGFSPKPLLSPSTTTMFSSVLYDHVLDHKQGEWDVLVSSGCQNKMPHTEWLKQQNLIFSTFWRLEIKVSAGVVSPKAPLLSL